MYENVVNNNPTFKLTLFGLSGRWRWNELQLFFVEPLGIRFWTRRILFYFSIGQFAMNTAIANILFTWIADGKENVIYSTRNSSSLYGNNTCMKSLKDLRNRVLQIK